MEELTLKERIDKVLDKRDELIAMSNILTPFMQNTYSSRLACLSSKKEVDKFAKELGQVVKLEKWDDVEYSHKYFFEYRGLDFYKLIEK